MSKFALILPVFCLLCLSQIAVASPEDTSTAEEFIGMLVKSDFTNAVDRLDSNMRAALPPDKLKDVWKSIIDRYGQYKRHVQTSPAKVQDYDAVIMTCEFEKSCVEIRIIFSTLHRISGLWFSPGLCKDEYKQPSYVKSYTFRQREVAVGSPEWSLPATLYMPQGEQAVPAVVMVHGSGPQDRDETIGPNKPFRDLAMGLASRGIAVLCYEKRTKQYSAKIALMEDNITVKEEVVDDAVAAVALLKRTGSVDPKRIFVLGHSLGGMMIPRIAKADPDIAGLIVMAGTSRPLEDVILEQTVYLFSTKGSLSEDDQKAIDTVKQQVARVKEASLSASTSPSTLPCGIPANYWLDLRGYDPPKAAAALTQPILILQGGRDYQVTASDYDRWKEALSNRKNVEFKQYPDLNHLFMTGQGKSTPAEYNVPGNVAEKVVIDIAEWVKANGKS
ncbi:MAG: alpha/beta fold hydrolase [Armatimonadota bacterium]